MVGLLSKIQVQGINILVATASLSVVEKATGGWSAQEISILVSNGCVIPVLLFMMYKAEQRRAKKQDDREAQRQREAVLREEELRKEKDETENKLIEELRTSRTEAVNREDFLREEAAKREAALMEGFKELTCAMHGIADDLKAVREDVAVLHNNNKEVPAYEGH